MEKENRRDGREKMKKVWKTVVVLGVAALLAVFAVRTVKQKMAHEVAIPPAKEYAVVVRTITPNLGRVTLTLPYMALVQNDNDVVLASKLSARVEMMHRAGARVKRGEPVVRLDQRDLDAKSVSLREQIASAKMEWKAAETALVALEAKHLRTKKLLAVRGASQEEFETEASRIAEAKAKIGAAKSRIGSLAATLREVEQRRDYALIKAPVSGVIGKTFVNPGDMAMPGKPLVSISARAGNYLLVRLPENVHTASLLYDGKKVKLHPLGRTFNGLLEYRTETLNSGLVTGERVDADIIVYDKKGLKLPIDAILDKNGEKMVLVVENGRAKALPVRIEAVGEQGVAVIAEELAGRPVIVAKPDILLKLLSGVEVVVIGELGTKSGNREATSPTPDSRRAVPNTAEPGNV